MPNHYRADEHYKVRRHPVDKTVTVLVCARCDFTVARHEVRAPGAKSGLPIYNKMRGKMVHHVHTAHPEAHQGGNAK